MLTGFAEGSCLYLNVVSNVYFDSQFCNIHTFKYIILLHLDLQSKI